MLRNSNMLRPYDTYAHAVGGWEACRVSRSLYPIPETITWLYLIYQGRLQSEVNFKIRLGRHPNLDG